MTSIRITHQGIRRRNRRAVAASLLPAVALGALLAVAAAGVGGDNLPAWTAAGSATVLAGLVGAAVAGQASLWRWAGTPMGTAPRWWTRGLPLLAVVCAGGMVVFVGGVANAVFASSRPGLWLAPLFFTPPLAGVVHWLTREPAFLRVRNARPADSHSGILPVAVGPAVSSGTLTIQRPILLHCAGCMRPIAPGEQVSRCRGDKQHQVHKRCVAPLCHHRCPECGHRID